MQAAGEYRNRVTIEQPPTQTQDSFGDVTPQTLDTATWTTFAAARWADVRTLQGREYFQAREEQSEVTHRIEMRYLAGVTTRMRVVYGSRKFNIKSVQPDESTKRWTVLMCEEVT